MASRNIFKFTIALFALLSVSVSSLAATYANHSVLATGTWKKISVNETGVCKITYDQLKSMGFSNPNQVQVYGYGGAMLNENFAAPKTDDLNETPMYDSGSAIFFYAQGPKSWNYRGLSKDHYFDVTSNLYSTLGYYFLAEKKGSRNLISKAEALEQQETEIEVDTYMEHILHKNETYNTIRSGKGWVGDQTPMGKSFGKSYSMEDIDVSQTANIYLSLAAASSRTSRCDIQINDVQKSLQFSLISGHAQAAGSHTTIEFTPTTGNNELTISYTAQSETDKFWVEQIVFSAFRKIKLQNGIVYFRNPNTEEPDNYKYIVEEAIENTIIWNITNPLAIQQMPTSWEGEKLVFRTNPIEMEEFVAFNPTSKKLVKAEYVGDVKNQDLHAYEGYDLIIISPKEFMSEAERLATLHETHDNLKTIIVTQEEIFNEFSSGTPDASAIRWFLKMFYDRGEAEKSVILFGDGSFDNRGILKNGNNTINNFIITYQGGALYDEAKSYVSDDYFCFLNNKNNGLTNGKKKMDYSIGRFPISNLQQATAMVNKVEKYLTENKYGKWKNKALLVADDNEGDTIASTVNRFFSYSDNIGKIIHSEDGAMEIQKVHFDAYTRVAGSNGYKYPEVEEIIKKNVEDGVMIVNYIGHSGELAWSAERVFTQGEAATIYNDKQGFWFTASCRFASFDELTVSGGEDLVLNPNGGAITLFCAARTVYDDKNDNINRSYISNIFKRDENGEPLTIGEVCRLAKVALENDSNKLSYTLLGDPALKIKYPEENVTTDSIIFIGQNKTDTLKALSEVKIFGHIEDRNEQLLDQFNGIVNITLYDKETRVYTKANSLKTEDQKQRGRHGYYDRLNILFSGKAEVKNGKFTTVLKIPKDINYNYGTGRIHYYAYDEVNEIDADGYDESFIIGGSNDSEITDSCGPTIRLYINHNGFVSGDKANTTPVLIAEISDENGINSSGSGIGHDITLISSDNPTDPVILNSYFSYELDSYSKGSINYQFPELTPGNYTIKLKAWDLLNNSSEKSIDFVVDETEPIRIHRMEIFPNVASDEATIRISHDRPNMVYAYRVRIFNMTGTEVYHTDFKQERLQPNMEWTWDLTNNKKEKVENGIYLIRAEFETEDGEIIGLSEKVMVRAK